GYAHPAAHPLAHGHGLERLHRAEAVQIDVAVACPRRRREYGGRAAPAGRPLLDVARLKQKTARPARREREHGKPYPGEPPWTAGYCRLLGQRISHFHLFHACSICTSSSGYFGRHPSVSTARVGSATNCGGSPGLRDTTSAAIRRPVTRLAASSTFLTDAPRPVPRLNLSDDPRSSRNRNAPTCASARSAT